MNSLVVRRGMGGTGSMGDEELLMLTASPSRAALFVAMRLRARAAGLARAVGGSDAMKSLRALRA
jgi:hypothetical protein